MLSISPVFDAGPYSFSIDEDAQFTPVPALVGSVSATDPQSQTVTYSFSGESEYEAAFSLDPTSGDIVLACEMDYESYPSFDLTLHATDPDGNIGTTTLLVTINDVNESPAVNAAPYVSGMTFTATEDSDGSTVYGELTGPIIDDLATEGTFTMEIDYYNDGSVDWTSDAPTGVTGIYSEADLSLGTVDIAVRLTEHERDGQTIVGPWVVESVTVAPKPNTTAPSIVNLTFEQFDPYDGYGGYAQCALTADIDDDTRGYGQYEITIEKDGYGSYVGTIPRDSESFMYVDDFSFDGEEVTVSIREIDESYQSLNGNSVDITVAPTQEANTAPKLVYAEFNYTGDDGYGGIYGDLELGMYDETERGYYTFELDDGSGYGTIDYGISIGDEITISSIYIASGDEGDLLMRVVEKDTSSGSEIASCAWTGCILNTNVAPEFSASEYEFTEYFGKITKKNIANGDVPATLTVGTVTATDADPSDTLEYKLITTTIPEPTFRGYSYPSASVGGKAFAIDSSTGVITINSADFANELARDLAYKYVLTIEVSDGMGHSEEVEVTIFDDYEEYLMTIDNYIEEWTDTSIIYAGDVESVAELAFNRLAATVSGHLDTFKTVSGNITNMVWATSTVTPFPVDDVVVAVAAVSTQIIINTWCDSSSSSVSVILDEVRESMQDYLDSDEQELLAKEASENVALGVLREEIDDMTTATLDVKAKKAAEYLADIKSRLPIGLVPPDETELYGELLMQFVVVKDWEITGSASRNRVSGVYWTPGSYQLDFPWFQAVDIAQELNAIAYYPADKVYVNEAGYILRINF